MGTTIFYLLIFLLILFLLTLGIGYLIIKPISYPAEKKGNELLQYLRNNPYDVRKILGEMRYIAEMSFYMYDEYNKNKSNANNSILFGLANFRKQNKLVLAMNRNVKAEWVPRFKFLNEIQYSFNKDSVLNNAFKSCREIDNGIRKLSLWNINLSNFYESTRKQAKFALKTAAIGAIVSIAVVGVTWGMINKGGKDIGYSPKSNARYRDPETGNLFDESGNRVPY